MIKVVLTGTGGVGAGAGVCGGRGGRAGGLWGAAAPLVRLPQRPGAHSQPVLQEN